MLESENGSSRNRDQFDVETISRRDLDLGFKNLSMSRSWITFKIENTYIENVENAFFYKQSLYKIELVLITDIIKYSIYYAFCAK